MAQHRGGHAQRYVYELLFERGGRSATLLKARRFEYDANRSAKIENRSAPVGLRADRFCRVKSRALHRTGRCEQRGTSRVAARQRRHVVRGHAPDAAE